jgi:hypothetical protein
VTFGDGLSDIFENAFAMCGSLQAVSLPAVMHSIGWSAFVGCVSLEVAKLPVKLAELNALVFDGCVNLRTLAIGEVTTWIDDRLNRSKPFLGIAGVTRLELLFSRWKPAFSDERNLTQSLAAEARVLCAGFPGKQFGTFMTTAE